MITSRARAARVAVTLGLALFAKGAASEPVPVDRAVVRFIAPEAGGIASPQFIFERVLAFQARLEALTDAEARGRGDSSYRERHVRAAMERHISETLLASLEIDPPPTKAELTRRTTLARKTLAEHVGGEARLASARDAEGLDEGDVLQIVRRRARASLYLDRMVAPMIAPSRAELRNLHSSAVTPYRGLPFERAEPALRRFIIARRFEAALTDFYRNARGRLRVIVLAGR